MPSAWQGDSSVSDSSPLDLSDCSFWVLFPKYFLIPITFYSQLAKKVYHTIHGGSIGSVADSLVMITKYKQL